MPSPQEHIRQKKVDSHLPVYRTFWGKVLRTYKNWTKGFIQKYGREIKVVLEGVETHHDVVCHILAVSGPHNDVEWHHNAENGR